MKLLLIRKDNILKINLPQNIPNSYWITDHKNEKILKITANKEFCELKSNNYFKILNAKCIRILNDEISIINPKDNIYFKKGIIQEGKMYPIALGNLDNIGILYCLPDEDSNDFKQFNIINTDEIIIGSSKTNQIEYKNNFVSDVHAKLYKKEQIWYIKNYNSLYGVFVNNFPINNNEKKIFNGDVIFIMGLKFILINNTIYINNPNNNLKLDKKFFIPTNKKIYIPNQNDDFGGYDDIEVNIEKNDYFDGPRLMGEVETEEIKIDPPPSTNLNKEKPLLLTLGSSIAMSTVMILSLFTSMNGIVNDNISFSTVGIPLITAITMLIAMIVLPIINIKYDKKLNEKRVAEIKIKYRKYLDKKMHDINLIKHKQKEYLYKNYASTDECINIIKTNHYRLWERKIGDTDFLSIRLGVGGVPTKINVKHPEESFSIEDNDLLEQLNDVVNSSKTIENAPIILSLIKHNISAIVSKDENLLNNYIKNLILQLITFQSYLDLKLVFLLNDNTINKWDYAKLLPHVWDNEKQIRFFADNYNDINEISRYLVEELNNRNKFDNIHYTSYYLIITDNYHEIQNFKIIQEICNSKKNLGFSLFCMTDEIFKLPNKCKMVINIDGTNAKIHTNESHENIINDFKIEPPKIIFYEDISQSLSNITLNLNARDVFLLPMNYSFLEMYNIEKIDDLKIDERWKENDSTLSLKAPIGIDSNGRIISLDVHEKFHGPHGLIAGSTGSGKSEFIITYILSLAINYHPYDVSFLLIDYKGGGLAGAFKKNQLKLPHLVGTITNIERTELQRALVSIQSELRKRQIAFNEVRNMTNEGTIDIYKYQKLYHDGKIKKPIPHLFIICDEFAELKQQQEDFMDELISVSRIGRSLGVHLVLATQKPAGIVNDQIRSNSKFAVCLKVQDISDSIDVINKQDAAYLKNPGQFYMQIGHNEYSVLGQSRLGRCTIYT